MAGTGDKTKSERAGSGVRETKQKFLGAAAEPSSELKTSQRQKLDQSRDPGLGTWVSTGPQLDPERECSQAARGTYCIHSHIPPVPPNQVTLRQNMQAKPEQTHKGLIQMSPGVRG